MKHLYIIIASLLLIFPSLSGIAQEREDALMIWSTTTISKSMGKENKWTLGVLSEYRHQIHEGVSKTNQYFLRPSVAYKILPYLSLKYQMDFAATSSGFQMRFIPEISFTHKEGDFAFSFRQRSQTTWKVETGTNSTVLRTRAKAEYSIPKTPMGVHFALEPYWCDFSRDSFAWFQRIRWYAGFSIKLTEHLTLIPEYECQAYYNHKGRYDRRTYDDHIIYFTFAVKL